MFLDPAPITIALAIILSTSPHVLAVPHRKHHNKLLGRAGEVEYYEQQHANDPMFATTLPAEIPPVTVESVQTITVTPTPAMSPMPSNMQFQLPPGMPLPDGTRKPVDMKSASTASSSSTSKTTSKAKITSTSSSKMTTSASKTSSTTQTLKPSSASTTSVSSVVVALPTKSFTVTVSEGTSVQSIVTPTSPAMNNVHDGAAELLGLLGMGLNQLTGKVGTAKTSKTDSTKSNAHTEGTKTDATKQSTASTATTGGASVCGAGTARKCCSAVHNNLDGLVGLVDGLLGLDLGYLTFDTAVGYGCNDIDDEDIIVGDGGMCWDVVSCCENNALSTLDEVFVGCVPIF
ncbi:hypothetical protein TMatcc_007316 [Talaromyces marneffei ATCC 18224]|uniref:Hydrophobin n=1 Tax=Talaromyces marneffei (strain ATCC 18224 / CBS 334.59 / QM 7333) TaxID=441960 RepID=B6QFK7_TALMQ|nr:uncharacterized protein EYB26_004291 [Talaromyces marneffei]EEA24242.1 hypothetical protein PMAA_082480 [Talaromyces marneffei ATCC 18224]KAE8553247.1 hypothetical protein EYB25_004629 [Talaromyces marneffei]QGA16624.1 hypothetical protein EYB26_004291 [Talaromyces marneffei]